MTQCAEKGGRSDARSVTTTYNYDAESRLTSKTYSDTTPSAYFYYDESSVTVAGTKYTVNYGKGRMTHTSADGGSALTIESFDPAGRTTDLWQCTPYNCSSTSLWDMSYNYTYGGFVNYYNHPASFSISNGWSDAGWLSEIYYTPSGGGPQTMATLTYAPTGAVATLLNGGTGSDTETYDYNNRLQTTRIQLGNSGSKNNLACWVYNYYGNVGNPTSCAVPSQGTGNDGDVLGQYYKDSANTTLSNTTSLAYDPTHRLATSVATGNSTYNLAFSYDRYGNMTCTQNQNTQGLCPQYTFSASTNQITTSGYTYDAAGDLTNDGTHSYQYDAEGRMISVDSGTTATYVYNALGQRVEKDVSGTYTEYVYDKDGSQAGEYNRTSWETWADFEGRHLFHFQGGSTYFTHMDRLGTTAIVTSWSTGNVVQDELHYPWGQEWTMAGTLQEERFAMLQHRDSETALDPTHYRMYSSGDGRWQSPDPVSGDVSNPQRFNRYSYVVNNPADVIDPQGACIDCGCGGSADTYTAVRSAQINTRYVVEPPLVIYISRRAITEIEYFACVTACSGFYVLCDSFCVGNPYLTPFGQYACLGLCAVRYVQCVRYCQRAFPIY